MNFLKVRLRDYVSNDYGYKFINVNQIYEIKFSVTVKNSKELYFCSWEILFATDGDVGGRYSNSKYIAILDQTGLGLTDDDIEIILQKRGESEICRILSDCNTNLISDFDIAIDGTIKSNNGQLRVIKEKKKYSPRNLGNKQVDVYSIYKS